MTLSEMLDQIGAAVALADQLIYKADEALSDDKAFMEDARAGIRNWRAFREQVKALEASPPEIVFLYNYASGWAGMYVAGILVAEDNRIYGDVAVEALGYGYRELDRDSTWFSRYQGKCPNALTEDMKAELAGDNPDEETPGDQQPPYGGSRGYSEASGVWN